MVRLYALYPPCFQPHCHMLCSASGIGEHKGCLVIVNQFHKGVIHPLIGHLITGLGQIVHRRYGFQIKEFLCVNINYGKIPWILAIIAAEICGYEIKRSLRCRQANPDEVLVCCCQPLQVYREQCTPLCGRNFMNLIDNEVPEVLKLFPEFWGRQRQ